MSDDPRPVEYRTPDEQTPAERAAFLAREIFGDPFAPEREIAAAILTEIRRFTAVQDGAVGDPRPVAERPPDDQSMSERAAAIAAIAQREAVPEDQLADRILIEILRFARPPWSTRIRVKTIAGRDVRLTCGHRFTQGAAHRMPPIGAAALCPICGKT